MNCKQCGTYNPDGSRYCNGCGTVIGSDETWKCPACETINSEDICQICGTKRPVTERAVPEQQHTHTSSGQYAYMPPENHTYSAQVTPPKQHTYTPPAYSERVSPPPVYPVKKKNHAPVILVAIIGFLVVAGIGINFAFPIVQSMFSTYEQGYIDGNYYNSEFAEIRFEIPEEWKAQSDSELASMNEDGAVWEYMGESPDGASFGVCVEDTQSPLMSVRTYIEQLERTVRLPYAEQGISVLSTDVSKTASISGNLYNIFELKANSNGVDLTQRYYIRKKGKYMICILITTVDDLTLSQDELIAKISEY